jgi:hypothetical protein
MGSELTSKGDQGPDLLAEAWRLRRSLPVRGTLSFEAGRVLFWDTRISVSVRVEECVVSFPPWHQALLGFGNFRIRCGEERHVFFLLGDRRRWKQVLAEGGATIA